MICPECNRPLPKTKEQRHQEAGERDRLRREQTMATLTPWMERALTVLVAENDWLTTREVAVAIRNDYPATASILKGLYYRKKVERGMKNRYVAWKAADAG